MSEQTWTVVLPQIINANIEEPTDLLTYVSLLTKLMQVEDALQRRESVIL